MALVGDVPNALNNYTKVPPIPPMHQTEDIQKMIEAAIKGNAKGKKGAKAQKGAGFSIAR
jgi:hypothetical protein